MTKVYKVNFWATNEIQEGYVKTVFVKAKSKDEAIYNAVEKTGLNILANEPAVNN